MPPDKTEKALFEHIDALLAEEFGAFGKKHAAYMSVHPNMTDHVLKALERHAKI